MQTQSLCADHVLVCTAKTAQGRGDNALAKGTAVNCPLHDGLSNNGGEGAAPQLPRIIVQKNACAELILSANLEISISSRLARFCHTLIPD